MGPWRSFVTPEPPTLIAGAAPSRTAPKKRGRPFGSGTGTHFLRAYHKEVEQQQRADAVALALAVAPAPGSAAYARDKWVASARERNKSKAQSAQLVVPLPEELLASVVDAGDPITKPLAELLACQTTQTGGGQKLRRSKEFNKVAAMYLHPANSRSLVGSLVEKERFGMARTSAATSLLNRMGALTYFCQRLHVVGVLLELLGALLSGKQLPHLLVILLASDSTPLPVSHGQKRRTQEKPASDAPGTEVKETAIVVRQMVARSADFRSTARKHSKVLQSEVQYVITTKDPNKDPEIHDDYYTTYEFMAFCPLAHLDRGTGENTGQAWTTILYLFGIKVLRDLFEREGYVVKVNLADRDGANGCADDSWAAETSSAMHLRVPCVLHMTHTVCGAACLIFHPIISGVIAHLLVLKQGHHAEQFFDILVDVLEASADLFVDIIPPAADAPHRVRQGLLLDMLLNETEVDQRRAYILKGNLVGDFSEERIPVYASSADAGTTTESHKSFIRGWAHDTAAALYVPCNPLNRSRWMLSVRPVHESTLLAVVSNLGRRTYDIFEAKHRPITSQKRSGDTTTESQQLIRAGGFAVPPLPPSAAKGEATRTNAAGRAALEENEVEVENRRLRGDALVFWRSNAADLLIVLSTCLFVLRILFAKLVKMSSVDWDAQQRAKETKGEKRTYRLFEAASGQWTDAFFKKVDDLMWDPLSWRHLPPRFQTERVQSRAYSLLVKLAGGVRHHVGTFLLMPFAIFRLLTTPDERPAVAQMLLDIPKCMLDTAFSLPFLLFFPTVAALCSTGCLIIVMVLALVTRCDTGRIECRHAAIRNLLVAKSGTWATHMAHLSANFMCSMSRRSGFVVSKRPTKPESKAEDKVHPRQAQGSQGGGPHRYFVRQWLSGAIQSAEGSLVGDQSSYGRKKSFTRLWEAYRELKARGGPEWDNLVHHGALGTHASSAGGPAFGPKPSRLPRSSVPGPRLSRPSAWQAGSSAGPSAEHSPGAGHTTTAIVALPGMEPQPLRLSTLKEMTAQARAKGVADRRDADQELEEIEKWSEATVLHASISLECVLRGVLNSGATAFPTSFLPRTLWLRCKTDILSMVTKVNEQAPGHLLDKIDAAWSKMHETFLHLSAPQLDLTKRCKRKLCYYARVCVCGRDDLRKFVRDLVRQLKPLCAKGKPLRGHLDDCELVVELVPSYSLPLL